MNVLKARKEFGNEVYQYIQIKRVKDIAIYKQCEGVKVVSYEVHKIRMKELKGKAFGNEKLLSQGYTHKEYLPCSNDFGKYGWSFQNLEMAENEMNKLLGLPFTTISSEEYNLIALKYY